MMNFMISKLKLISIFSLMTGLWLAVPMVTVAQELHEDLQAILQAKVIEVVSEKETVLSGTNNNTLNQTLRIEILSGAKQGEFITLENDYIKLKPGDKFFLYYLKTINGDEIYTVGDYDRRLSLLFIVGLFIVVVIFFGGWQGARSLISLLGSFLVILYILGLGYIR